MPTRQIQVSLGHGQIDKNLAARQDSSVYQNGLLTATNWKPLAQGGVTRRPGFAEQTGAPSADGKRLLSWEFDQQERYILSVGNTTIRFYRVVPPLTFLSAVDISPFWTSATDQEIIELEVAVRSDTMLLAHRNLRPLVIVRTSLDTFSVSLFDFTTRSDSAIPEVPTIKFAAANILMQPCDINGVGQTTVSAGQKIYVQWFNSDPRTGLFYDPVNLEVGAYLRYNNVPLKITGTPTAQDRIEVEALQDLPKTRRINITYDAGSNQTIWLPYETVLAAEDAGEGLIVSWTTTTIDVIVIRGDFLTDGASIVGSESGNVAKITGAGTWIEMAPTSWWEESVYSNYRGWFGAVTFFQQRLWIGGSWDMPAFLCASKIQQYFNFDVGDGGDVDSIQVALAKNNPGMVLSLLPARHLQIFTTTSEHYIGETEEQPITPKTISVRSGSNFGIGQASPRHFGGNVYFTGKDNKQLRINGWDDVNQQYNAPPIGFLHQDLLTGIKEVHPAYAQDGSPAQYLYVLNDDGTMLLIFSTEIQNTPRGFWPWTSSEPFQSLAEIDNDLYLLIDGKIYLAQDSLDPDTPSILESNTLVMDWSEGNSRGRFVRQGKIELDVREASEMQINGRNITEQITDGKVDFFQYGWTRDPRVRVEVSGTGRATILSILQEVSL